MRYALAAMRLGCHYNPNALYAGGVGYMVVSIYTYQWSKAKEIAQKAGNGVPPVLHHLFTPKGQGKVLPGRFKHFHNGEMFAKYPSIEGKPNEQLPHSYFGDFVWVIVVV